MEGLAMTTFDANPDRSTDELLKDIQQGAVDTSKHTRFVGAVLAPLAALLVISYREKPMHAHKQWSD
jgi:hypothetical protein